MKAMTRRTTCATIIAFLTGCGREPQSPLNSREREIAIAAVDQLRSGMNAGNCEAVQVSVATDAQTHDWLATCRSITNGWGEWKSFRPSRWHSVQHGVVMVEGAAAFNTGNHVVRTVWDLRSAEPRILALVASGGNQRIAFPVQQFDVGDPSPIPPDAQNGAPWVAPK